MASMLGVKFSDKVYAHYRAKNNGVGTPEMRIPVLIIGSLFIPVGLLYVSYLCPDGWHLLTIPQLVWMVCSCEDPLDHAYNWYRNFRLRPYVLLVSTNSSC